MSPADRAGRAHPQNDPAAHSSVRPSGHLLPAMQHSTPHAGQMSSRSVDSWIEISSQPSSSSLSSIAGDEIVTTGLRVQHEPAIQRRRHQMMPGTPLRLYQTEATAGEGSSQDEYEESGSESDRILTSSNEELTIPLSEANSIPRRAPPSATSADAEDEDDLDDDEDESGTALGTHSNQACFTPQPNAFSHPPSASRAPDSYFSSSATTRPATRSAPQRRSSHSTRQTPSQHTPLSASSYHADHDAALRASLSTLLSCAAAARGLPKPYTAQRAVPASSNRIEPSTLRMVPQSALAASSPARARSSSTSSARSGRKDDSKRKSQSRSASKERAQLAKKLRAADAAAAAAAAEPVSPTLLTWVVSAGVLVLVSALSFSAGYTAGRETGRVEALGGPTPTVAEACGREDVVRAGSTGLRRLRWSAGATAVAAGA